jgi:PEGA domain
MMAARNVAGLVLAALLPACVSRTMYLSSEPPGATVILDGRRVGTTPYEEAIPAWGTRRLELELAGHERFATDLQLETPWWDHWPLDMFSAVWPGGLHVERRFDFALQALAEPDLGWDAAERALDRAHADEPAGPRP